MKYLIVALGGLLAIATPAGAADLLTNGGFEQPGGIIRQQLTGANDIPGWTYDASGGGYDIYEDDSQDGLSAADGTHYVSFGHNGTTGGSLSQTFATHAGGHFRLSLSTAEQQGHDPLQQFYVLLTVNTGNSYGFTIGNLTSAFSTTVQDFFPNGAFTTVSITDATPAGAGAGSNLALDAVHVVDVDAGAVPEPATWAMMIGGLGLIGGSMRRRRGGAALAHT